MSRRKRGPPRPRAKYVLKQTTADARAMITEIQYKMDINTLHRLEEDKDIKMNDIARVKIRSTKPIFAPHKHTPNHLNRLSRPKIIKKSRTLFFDS